MVKESEEVSACRYLFSLRGGSGDKPDTNKVCIGIDLGTTYSCVGVWRNGRVEICTNDQGNRITPSYVGFTENGERLIGDAAKNQAASNPTGTVYDAKRLIGRKFSDETVQKDAKLLPFKIKERSGKILIEVDIKGTPTEFNPEEISAMVLTKMKETAEAFLGKKVGHPVCKTVGICWPSSDPFFRSLPYNPILPPVLFVPLFSPFGVFAQTCF